MAYRISYKPMTGQRKMYLTAYSTRMDGVIWTNWTFSSDRIFHRLLTSEMQAQDFLDAMAIQDPEAHAEMTIEEDGV